MAISEVCKFEVKEEVDKAILENRVSQAEALRGMKRFYESIGLEVKFETLRTKYNRAKNVSNETKKSKATENTPDVISERKPQGGGKRKGAGRPRIDKSKIISTDFKGAFNIFFKEVKTLISLD